MYTGNINIRNESEQTVIDLEGIIGIPEDWQFDTPEEKVSTYDKFKAKVNEIKNIKSASILVNILGSPGGAVNDAILIYDTLKELNAKVTTKGYGYFASAATIVFQAADKGNREISENALFLAHKSSTYSGGNANDIKVTLSDLEKTDDIIAGIYAANSDKDKDHFMAIMDRANGRGEWLTPDEAITLGFADKKTKKKKCVSNIQNMHLPEIPKNLINDNMNIKDSLQFIKNLFDKKTEVDESDLDKINDELKNQSEKITDLSGKITEKDTLITDLNTQIADKDSKMAEKDAKITDLESQIVNLNSEIDQLKSKKTETEAKEDPLDEPLRGNAAAYAKDMEQFKD